MIQQIFMMVIATFTFLILIAKIVSAVDTNDDRKRRSKSKSKKKVRFAIDHDEEFVTSSKLIVEPSETKSVVFDTNEKVNHVVDKDQSEMIFEENVVNRNENSMYVKLLCDDFGIAEDEKEKQGLISDEDDDSDDDDWEGIEPSDLEKVFAVAAKYGNLDDKLHSLENDVQMKLYGLHKIATEGPCRETQPIALKASARAKWNAWKKLGVMNQDVAMEQYVTLLSEKAPEWSRGSFCIYADEGYMSIDARNGG